MERALNELNNDADNELLAAILDRAMAEWQFDDEYILEQMDLEMVIDQNKLCTPQKSPMEPIETIYLPTSGISLYTDEDYIHPDGLIYDSESDDFVHATQLDETSPASPIFPDDESNSIDVDVFLAQLNREDEAQN